MDIEKIEDGDTTTFRVKMPILPDDEIKEIDNNFNTIVDMAYKTIVKDKDLAILQHIIQKQRERIDKAIEYIETEKWYPKSIDNLLKILKGEDNE